MKRLVLTATLIVTMSATAAIAGPAKSKIEPCSLMTTSDIEKIIGPLRTPAKSDTDVRGYPSCDYTNDEGANLKILVYGADQWGLRKGEVSEMKPKSLSQIGEEAYWVKRGSSIEVYAKKGAHMVEIVSTISGGIEAPRKVAALLMKKL